MLVFLGCAFLCRIVDLGPEDSRIRAAVRRSSLRRPQTRAVDMLKPYQGGRTRHLEDLMLNLMQ